MDIVVPIKLVPDLVEELEINEDGNDLDRDFLSFRINEDRLDERQHDGLGRRDRTEHEDQREQRQVRLRVGLEELPGGLEFAGQGMRSVRRDLSWFTSTASDRPPRPEKAKSGALPKEGPALGSEAG